MPNYVNASSRIDNGISGLEDRKGRVVRPIPSSMEKRIESERARIIAALRRRRKIGSVLLSPEMPLEPMV